MPTPPVPFVHTASTPARRRDRPRAGRAARRPNALAATVLAGVLSIGTALATIASVSPARADGVYVVGGGGFNLLVNPDLDFKGTTGVDRDYETDGGFTIAGGVGYRWQDFLFEYEGAFSYNTLDQETLSTGVVTALPDSSVRSLRSLFNIIYEVPLDIGVRPYVGGGIGIAAVSLDDGVGSDTGFAFAYQAKAGLAYALTDNLDLFGQYRFVGATGLELDTTFGTADFGNMNHSFEIGLRYTFGDAPRRRTASRPSEPISVMPATANSGFILPDSAVNGTNAQSVSDRPQLALAPVPVPEPVPPQGAKTSGVAEGSPVGGPTPVAQARATAPIAAMPQSDPLDGLDTGSIGYGVQVGAYRSDQSALSAWPQILRRNGRYIEGSQPVVRAETVPGKGVLHRLYAGGMDKSRAEAVCARLKADGQWCQVAAL